MGTGFLEVAGKLLDQQTSEQVTKAQMRRAASSLYYALFHSLSFHFANALVGPNPTGGLAKAWVEVYRGMEHKNCVAACN
ncbi:hypothetical protein IQ250_30650, partial [Pseudanabaenaceae cyanobacterium LEGE 13415]|nr:hypothetical protein [Pseudanabaenaceae cyanobacterium LEGE 13415]